MSPAAQPPSTPSGAHGDPTSSASGRSAARRGGTGEPVAAAEIAAELGEAAAALGKQLRDPALARTVEEFEEISRGFAATTEGMAEGISGMTEWLRAAGHAGTVTGNTSVVADRLSHIGNELNRLCEVLRQAEQQAD